MYLEKLSLQNIRVLADQEISFLDSANNVRLWTVFIADNGYCKSTILQAIALAGMGTKYATRLVPDAQTMRNRFAAKNSAFIEAHFRGPSHFTEQDIPSMPAKEVWRIPQSKRLSMVAHYQVQEKRHDWEIVPRSIKHPPGSGSISHEDSTDWMGELRAVRAQGWLLLSYGVGRTLARPGEVPLPEDVLLERVDSLFNPAHPILGLEFYKLLRERRLHREYAQALRDVLSTLGPDRLPLFPEWPMDLFSGDKGLARFRRQLESNHFEIQVGSRTLKLTTTALSDGYKTTIAWIADLIGHAFLDYGKEVDPKKMEGIVLLDEIDLHLHPTWQHRIVSLLRHAFPCLQFVVTTHSPLVLPGFDANEIFRLRRHDDEIVAEQMALEPGMMSASEVLSAFFDVPRAARPELVNLEKRYLTLRVQARRSISAPDKIEMKRIEAELLPYWRSTGEGNADQPNSEVSPQQMDKMQMIFDDANSEVTPSEGDQS